MELIWFLLCATDSLPVQDHGGICNPKCEMESFSCPIYTCRPTSWKALWISFHSIHFSVSPAGLGKCQELVFSELSKEFPALHLYIPTWIAAIAIGSWVCWKAGHLESGELSRTFHVPREKHWSGCEGIYRCGTWTRGKKAWKLSGGEESIVGHLYHLKRMDGW